MFTAIIPVKKNSSRLPGKNLKIFGKENLLTRKIRQLKESKIADRIIVSSDCTKMLQVAKDANVDAVIRPTCYADESKPATEFFPYLASLIPEGHFIYSCVTSPHFDAKLMIEAKNKYLEAINDSYNS